MHIKFCMTFFNEKRGLFQDPIGPGKIRKSKALRPSEDETADLACYEVGQSPK
jgi:hypothetical protein